MCWTLSPATNSVRRMTCFSYIRIIFSFLLFRHSSSCANLKRKGKRYIPFIRFTLWSIFVNFCVCMRARMRAFVAWRTATYTCGAYRVWGSFSLCVCMCGVCVYCICSHTLSAMAHKIDHTRYFCAIDRTIRVKYKYIRNSAHFCDNYGIIMGFQVEEYAFVCIRKSRGTYRHEATWSNATD